MLVDAVRFDLQGPPPSYLLLDRQGRFLAELGQEEAKGADTPGGADGARGAGGASHEYGYWPVEELPPRVVAAALALEDRRFYAHPGVDPLAIGRALYQNVAQGERVSGASTIAMQVARLLDPGERTYWRKLRETWRALAITLRYGRQEVLAAYLRLVPYGNRVRGIAYAARRYLDKPVADLSWAEIAFLSAIPQAPALMNPFREDGRQRAVARGSRILDQLRASEVLSAAEFELARQQIRELQLPAPAIRPATSLHAVFRLREILAAAPPAAGAEPYRIVTSLDLDLQDTVAAVTAGAVAEWQGHGAGNAAVVLLDRQSNGVLAWLGSTDYFARDQAGALDYAATPRSPGSALKPFVYALALERGKITPATVLDDLPAVSDGIANADRGYLGPMLPRQALANSRNVPAARLLGDLGLDEGYAFLHELGLHDNAHEARRYGLGLVIGAMPVTLGRLVQAYSVLANDGQWRPLHWYAGQADAGRRLLSASTARTITLHLSDPSARLPSFPRMGSTEYAFPVALKTGSSQGLRDAWVVAYSRRYVIGVWVGHPDARPMRELTGASSAALIAQRILTRLHADERHGFADLAFPAPEGYQPVSLCGLTGKRATPACERVFEEWFAPGQAPRDDDDAYVRLAVDARNGQLAHARTPARYVEWRSFVNLPPRYADWAAQAGLPQPPTEVSQAGTAGTVLSLLSRPPAAARGGVGGVAGVGGVVGGRALALRVVAPGDGLKLLRDPTVPAGHNTIALRAEVTPAVREVLWLVDGQPFQLAPFPYTVRWPLQVGEHVIQVRSPASSEASAPVRIRVE